MWKTLCVEESAQWLTTLLVPQSDNGYASIKLATQPIPQEAEKNPPPQNAVQTAEQQTEGHVTKI